MKNLMKTKIAAKMIFNIAAIAMLSACGGDDDYLNNQYFNQLASACGTQLPPQSAYSQRVTGQGANGEFLDLMIYGDGNGRVGAVGEFYMGNMSSYNNNFYDPYAYNNLGMVPNPNQYLNNSLNNFNGGVAGDGCVSTNGMTGSMEMDGVADAINIQLTGPSFSLSSDMSIDPPTVENMYLSGPFLMQSGSGVYQVFFQ